jgi:uncharacterized protein YjcR
MGRQRDPNRDKAFEIFKASKGQINLIDIAAQLGVSDRTVRGWKSKDKWGMLAERKDQGPNRAAAIKKADEDTDFSNPDLNKCKKINPSQVS